MKRFLLLFLLCGVSCLVGATLGALVFANISDFLMYVLEVRFRGFYSLLINYLLFIGGVLGAFTGLIVALSHTGYRKAGPGWGASYYWKSSYLSVYALHTKSGFTAGACFSA